MDVEWSDWERRVLSIFVEDGRIARLPAQQKKRRVLLKWLASQVPPGIRIPQADFNQLLRQYHPDTATLRRELFEFGYVHRDRTDYWRDDTPPGPIV
jgi:hypothetical protein